MRLKFAIIVTLCALGSFAHAQGVTYFKGDIYAALGAAQKEQKLLMVEFYAPWSYRSRWMNENVIAKCSQIEDDFILHKVDTRTVDGAKLATDYLVTDYPNILIFNANGNVIERIDKSLAIEDFKAQIAQIIASTDGRNAWRMAQIQESADNGDRDGADRLMMQYINANKVEFLTTTQNWPLFSNSDITFYGSVGYWFVKNNIAAFPNADKVDEVLEKIYIDALMPYVIGNEAFDSALVSVITIDGSRFKSVDVVGALATLRSQKEYFSYVQTLEKAINILPERYEYPLVMSLDFVANVVGDGHNKGAKKAARAIVENLFASTISPVKLSLIRTLLDKFL